MNRRSVFAGYKTRQQIAFEYEISTKTLKAKLKREGIELPSGRVSLSVQKKIYDALGYPIGVSKEDYNGV